METTSLLDSVVGAMDEAWQTGTTWLEEEGTEFFGQFDQSDDPYAQKIKQGGNWSDLTDEEKDVFLAGGDEAIDTVFNFMGGGVGSIAKSAGNLIYTGIAKSAAGAAKKKVMPLDRPASQFGTNNSRGYSTAAERQAKVEAGIKRRELEKVTNLPNKQPFIKPGGEVAKATDDLTKGMSPQLAKARDGFAFQKGFDPIAYMREAKTPNQVMASWDAIRHKFSNYEALGNGLKHGEHEAWATEMYTQFAKALKSQGLENHAKIVMHQLSQRGNKVKQSYNSTIK